MISEEAKARLKKQSAAISRAQDFIRESGYVSAMELCVRLVPCTVGTDLSVIEDVLPQVVCEDIHRVEYAKKESVDYRRKDLYYYCPPDGKENENSNL
jgi:hypothetical protein